MRVGLGWCTFKAGGGADVGRLLGWEVFPLQGPSLVTVLNGAVGPGSWTWEANPHLAFQEGISPIPPPVRPSHHSCQDSDLKLARSAQPAVLAEPGPWHHMVHQSSP